MATGDFDADTLAWFINSVPARTLAIEPGEIEFANDVFSLSPGYDAVIAERDSLLATVEDLRAALARQIDRAEFWKTECGRREAANDVLIAEAKEIGAAIAAHAATDQATAAAAIDWQGMATIATNAALPDQVFIDDVETGNTTTTKIEPTDPRAVALARALKF